MYLAGGGKANLDNVDLRITRNFKEESTVLKKLSVLLIVFALAVPVTFAAKQLTPKEVVFWDDNPGPDRTPYLNQLINTFNAQNPDLVVKYVGIPHASAKEKYFIAIASDATPDCAGLAANDLAALVVQKDGIISLEKYFSKWREKNKLIKSYIDETRRSSPDNKLYMLPNTANAFCLWYRKDLFQKAGLKNAPATWDEFFTDVQKLTDVGNNQYGFSIRGGSGSDDQLLALMFAYSGYKSFWDQNGKCILAKPEMVEFLKKFTNIYGKYTPKSDITNGYKEMVAAFDSGVAAMIVHNLGSFGEHSKALKPDQFAAAPLPMSIKHNHSTLAGSINGYCIFKKSKNPNGAWRFISYLATAKVQSYWNKTIGQLPIHRDVLNEQWVKDAQHINAVATVLAAKNSYQANFPRYLPGFTDIRLQVAQPGFQAVLAGKKTPEQFLHEYAIAFDNAQKEYRQYLKKN
jgi:multiple sugar transport system substrate-binding protein